MPVAWTIQLQVCASARPKPRQFHFQRRGALFENGLGLLLATPLFPLSGYRERAESARSEPAGERANPKKEAPDRLNRGRGRMLGEGESINSTSSPAEDTRICVQGHQRRAA